MHSLTVSPMNDLVTVLLLYGLHPHPIETRVRQALDKVRPYLDSHGGNVELLSVNDGVVNCAWKEVARVVHRPR